MRTRTKIHNKGPEQPDFVTPTIGAWVPVFTHKDHFEILAGSLQYCRGKGHTAVCLCDHGEPHSPHREQP